MGGMASSCLVAGPRPASFLKAEVVALSSGVVVFAERGTANATQLAVAARVTQKIRIIFTSSTKNSQFGLKYLVVHQYGDTFVPEYNSGSRAQMVTR